MIKLDKNTKKQLLSLYQTKRIVLEGNILKLIDAGEDIEFENYLTDALSKDQETRRKRLEITKQVQNQNTDLIKWKEENEKIQEELKKSLAALQLSKEEAELAQSDADAARIEAEEARVEAELAKDEATLAKEKAETARETAENNLDLVQRKSQFELIGTVVKVSLIIILGVGLISTGLYLTAILCNKDTQVIGSTWSNLFGILLTNAFSIVGTIMGIKYASEKNNIN
jgi:hypothetical protein